MKEKLEEFIEEGGISTDYAGFCEWLDQNMRITDEQLDAMAKIEEKLHQEAHEALQVKQGANHESNIKLQSR